MPLEAKSPRALKEAKGRQSLGQSTVGSISGSLCFLDWVTWDRWFWSDASTLRGRYKCHPPRKPWPKVKTTCIKGQGIASRRAHACPWTVHGARLSGPCFDPALPFISCFPLSKAVTLPNLSLLFWKQIISQLSIFLCCSEDQNVPGANPFHLQRKKMRQTAFPKATPPVSDRQGLSQSNCPISSNFSCAKHYGLWDSNLTLITTLWCPHSFFIFPLRRLKSLRG